MVLLVIHKTNNYQKIVVALRNDEDIRIVQQITDRLRVYLEQGIEFEYKPT